MTLAILLLAAVAQSDKATSFYTGNELYEICVTEKGEPRYSANANHCRGFVAGINDFHSMVVHVNGQKPLFCPGDGVLSGQLQDVVAQHLKSNPQTRHYAAAQLATDALTKAFPCK